MRKLPLIAAVASALWLSRHSPIAVMTIGTIFTLTIGTTIEVESVAT